MLHYFERTLNSDLTSVKLGSMAWCHGLLPEVVKILARSSLSPSITSSVAHLQRFAADCSGQQLSFLRIVLDELKLIRLRARASSSGRMWHKKDGALYE
jgi:hypothetical protein